MDWLPALKELRRINYRLGVAKAESFFAECPRDEEGHCKPSGQSSASKPPEGEGKPAESSPHRPPPDVMAEAQKSEAVRSWLSGEDAKKPPIQTEGSAQHDNFHEELLKERGQAGAPQKATAAEVDAAIKAGGVEIFRGVEKPEHAEEFKAGGAGSRAGVHGSGVYCAYVDPEADPGSYKSPEWAHRLTTLYAKKNGAVMRMALPAGARVGDENVVKQEHAAFKRKLLLEMGKAAAKAPFSADARKRLGELARMRELYSDVGRYATAAGYDAVRVPDKGYMVLLNRKKVLAQSDNVPLAEGVL